MGWCRVGATGAQQSVNEWAVIEFVLMMIVQMNGQSQNLCYDQERWTNRIIIRGDDPCSNAYHKFMPLPADFTVHTS